MKPHKKTLIDVISVPHKRHLLMYYHEWDYMSSQMHTWCAFWGYYELLSEIIWPVRGYEQTSFYEVIATGVILKEN